MPLRNPLKPTFGTSRTVQVRRGLAVAGLSTALVGVNFRTSFSVYNLGENRAYLDSTQHVWEGEHSIILNPGEFVNIEYPFTTLGSWFARANQGAPTILELRQFYI